MGGLRVDQFDADARLLFFWWRSTMDPTPDPEILRELLEYRMPFGKYEGTRLLEIPEAYLAWLSRKGMPKGKLGVLLETALVVRMNGLEPLLRSLRADLARRE